MIRVLWYILCFLMLIWEVHPDSNPFACNRPNTSQNTTQNAPQNGIRKDTITQLAPKDDVPYTKVSFARAVLRGADEVDIANSYKAINKDMEIGGIYFHSTLYIEEAKAFLASPAYTTDQKRIAICLIQALPLKDYLSMVKFTESLFKKQKVDEMVLMWILAPDFGERQIIARSFQDPAVIATLKEMQEISGLSQTTKRVIHQILTGEEKKFIRF